MNYKLDFTLTGKDHADAEILNDFYSIHKMHSKRDQKEVNAILSKYGYEPSEDDLVLKNNMEEFKNNINSDESLTWRRVKMMDVGVMNAFNEDNFGPIDE